GPLGLEGPVRGRELGEPCGDSGLGLRERVRASLERGFALAEPRAGRRELCLLGRQLSPAPVEHGLRLAQRGRRLLERELPRLARRLRRRGGLEAPRRRAPARLVAHDLERLVERTVVVAAGRTARCGRGRNDLERRRTALRAQGHSRLCFGTCPPIPWRPALA